MGTPEKRVSPPPGSGLLDLALDILRQAASGRPYASQAQLARAVGESEANISRWLSGASTPTLRKLEPVLMALGVRFTLPEARNGAPSLPPAAAWETAAATAATRQAAATGNRLPPFIQVDIAENDRSMEPTLTPGDRITVDTRQQFAEAEDQIYLVRLFSDNTYTYYFRRIHIQQKAHEKIYVFYADNAKYGYYPMIYTSDQFKLNPVVGVAVAKTSSIQN